MAEETTIIEGIMEEIAPVVDDTTTTTSPDGETTTPAPGDTGEGGEVVIDDKGEVVLGDEGKKKDEPAVDETTRRLDDLEKANKGLLKELGKERGRRQNFEGRLSQVNDFLATVKEKRSKEDGQQLPPEPQAPDYLNFEFDSNDVPRIPLSVVKDLIKQQITPIHEEIIQGKKTQASGRKIDGIRAEAQKVIATDRTYPAAMQTLEQQWQWISREFDEYAKENNIQPKTQDDAENMIFESGIDAAFGEQFPDADFDSVVGAYMLPENATVKRAGARLRRALKVIAGSIPAKKTDKESLDQAKKLEGKSNFTGAPNRKQSGTSLTQIADLPLETLLSLNESQENQLYDLMEEE